MSDVQTRPTSFFDLFLAGKATADQVDDFVGAWHESGNHEQRYPATLALLTPSGMYTSSIIASCLTSPCLAGTRVRSPQSSRITLPASANGPVRMTHPPFSL
jgi:hypothetical protein